MARTKLLGFEPKSTKIDCAESTTGQLKRLVRPWQLRVLVVDELDEEYELAVTMSSDLEKLFDVGEA
jgi:hypothetical protein